MLDTSTTQRGRDAEIKASDDFLLWAIPSLGLSVELADRTCLVRATDDSHLRMNDLERFCFPEPTASTEATEASDVAAGYTSVNRAEVHQWVITKLGESNSVVHLAPRGQLTGIHQLSQQLFSYYQLDGGTLHLGGCVLEDRPLLCRVIKQSGVGGETQQLSYSFLHEDGRPLETELGNVLCLDRLRMLPSPPAVSPERKAKWLATFSQPDHSAPAGSVICLAVVWCKYAVGRLVATFPDSEAVIAFDGWGQAIAKQVAKPPPFVCPATGASDYALVTTDDGRITVPAGLGICAKSNRRVLVSELHECSVTGQTALPEYTTICPLTDQPVLNDALQQCVVCHQYVSPHAVLEVSCSACQSISSVGAGDARLARLLGEYPQLEKWRNWKLAETATVYIAVGTQWTKRLLWVVDKHDLRVLHAATVGRWFGSWHPLDGPLRDELMR